MNPEGLLATAAVWHRAVVIAMSTTGRELNDAL
jgi:hypothetical protein